VDGVSSKIIVGVDRLKRNRFNVTGELFIEMFKKDIIYLENEDPLPSDAKLLKVDVDRDSNQIIIEYESEEVPEVVEGARVSIQAYDTFRTKFKSVFTKIIGRKDVKRQR